MSAEKFKVVARLGSSTTIPVLINGEIGYDVDTKTFRVGDDTTTPVKIATNKSTGNITYLQGLTVKHGTIELYDGGKIDGIDPSTQNQSDGVVVRTANGEFNNRLVEGDEYLTVTNGDGKSGNIMITASDVLKDAIGAGNGTVRFTWGTEFPSDPQPGHLHFDENDEIIYIRAKQTNLAEFWLDIGSVSGGGGGGRKFFFRTDKPTDPMIGDEWFDPEFSRLYMYISENNHSFWLEKQF